MSSPGQPMDMNTLQAAFQQYQQQQRRMQMAQSLMGNNANSTTPNAGIANFGGDILGALAARHIQQQNDPMGTVNVTPQQLGGGIQGWAGRNLGGIGRLFSMGGS